MAGSAGCDDLPAFAAAYDPYPHQVESFCKAAQENVIVILPTGTGKTLIAAMLIDLYSTPESFILFVVNNVALVDQQAKYLSRVCKSPCSKINVAQSRCLNVGVTVGTAGSLLGLFDMLPIAKLALVVFDEVHHATGDHPYCQVLSLLHDYYRVHPRILGLTASWLHGELRDIEMKRHVLQSTVGATIFVPEVADALTNKATFTKVSYPGELPNTTYAQAMADAIKQATQALHPELAYQFASQVSKAMHVEMSLGAAGLSAFPHALCEIINGQLHAKATNAVKEEAREAAWNALQDLPQAKSLLHVDDSNLPTLYGDASAKAKVLLNLMAGRPGLTLILVEQVCCALPLAAMLASHLQEAVLHVSGTLTMLKETRDRHVQAFKDGACRVLVATAALEEGLDVPDCDCVIRYDAFSNVKSHVQGSGRARKAGSEVFYFDNTPAEEDRRTAVMYGTAPEAPAAAEGAAAPQCPGALPGGEQAGLGEGHAWGAEETLWDYQENKSFRGQRCAGCGASLRITSRKYGQGRKKTERVYSVIGEFVCPAQAALHSPCLGTFPAGETWYAAEGGGGGYVGFAGAQGPAAAAPVAHESLQPGSGEGHSWCAEDTLWDYAEDKSFRGQRCSACAACLKITSRKFGQGGKKTERLFAVKGPFVCPGRRDGG